MGTIKTEYDLPRNITFVKATGKMTPNDFRDWTQQYYAGTVTRHIIWNLTEADFSGISVGDVIEYTKLVGGDERKGGKTAIVAGHNWFAMALSKIQEVFINKSDIPFDMRTFTNMDEAMEWLGLLDKMTTTLEIDEDRKIIQRTVTGGLFTERSLELVRELAMVVNNYRAYNVLLDLRETGTKPEMLDLMEISSECAMLTPDFDSKIAFLIPNTDERIRFAQLFKDCMDAQGFRFRQFFDRDTAIEWLTE